METAWNIFASLLAGGLIGGAVSLWVSRQSLRAQREDLSEKRRQFDESAQAQRKQFADSARREHLNWLRERRYEVYSELLELAADFVAHWGILNKVRADSYLRLVAVRSKALAVSDSATRKVISDTNLTIFIPPSRQKDGETEEVAYQSLRHLEKVLGLTLRHANLGQSLNLNDMQSIIEEEDREARGK